MTANIHPSAGKSLPQTPAPSARARLPTPGPARNQHQCPGWAHAGSWWRVFLGTAWPMVSCRRPWTTLFRSQGDPRALLDGPRLETWSGRVLFGCQGAHGHGVLSLWPLQPSPQNMSTCSPPRLRGLGPKPALPAACGLSGCHSFLQLAACCADRAAWVLSGSKWAASGRLGSSN